MSGDKQVRADPFAAQLNGGNVWCLRAPWNGAFVEELRQFPSGRHDDAVDAAADAFNELTAGAVVMMPSYAPPGSAAAGYEGREGRAPLPRAHTREGQGRFVVGPVPSDIVCGVVRREMGSNPM